MPRLNASFEDAIRITPQGNNKYSADLRSEWCIGTVPHGGYTTAVIYNLALTHFAHAHPKLFDTPRIPNLPPTIGARTSTIHIKLLQPSEKKPDQLQVNVTGYITVSPPSAEVGITGTTGWKPLPPPPPGSLPDGKIDFPTLARTGKDGAWEKLSPPFLEFRRAGAQLELFAPGKAEAQQQRTGSMAIDQWARFQPGGDKDGRWTDAAVVYLLDMFPMALDGFDTLSATAVAEAQGEPVPEIKAKFWYPTVTLNIDMKKHLPKEGVEWLYSRVVTKVVRGGRTDLDVTVLDQNGEVVALSTQVGLIVSASRNVGTRKFGKL
ncbi:uncharacterized protein N7473_010860 [Penicillium subrubescens]|uniref:uncharacterized protein n=1 Tax=Penicillium subrubescens TaxID=1316194 RepID=UPI002545B52D|nr:uncharacterized protein N7473_010860 [Penicillium subrubescens]KAJ5883974.1 hypothetical protein N7473_010860 [Penicillium subrubescens]